MTDSIFKHDFSLAGIDPDEVEISLVEDVTKLRVVIPGTVDIGFRTDPKNVSYTFNNGLLTVIASPKEEKPCKSETFTNSFERAGGTENLEALKGLLDTEFKDLWSSD